MINSRHAVFSLTFLSSIVLTGCYSGLQVKGTESAVLTSEEVEVEAYLFDIKLRRKGKPTSIRLDLYQTDTVVAMYGRAYFNKGAFSGRITSDSMQVVFPSTKEYLFESIENLFLSFDCESELIGLNLLAYFIKIPSVDSVFESLIIEQIEDEENKKGFKIFSRNCPWILTLTYSNEEPGLRINAFEFDDGKDVTLKGSRRIYKVDAVVSADRFQVEIPAEAVKIKL